MTVACAAWLSAAQIDTTIGDEGDGTRAAKDAVRRFLGEPGPFEDGRDDLVQQIRIHLWQKLLQLNTPHPNLVAWLRDTANNKVSNLIRDRKAAARREARARDALARGDGRSRLNVEPDQFERVLSSLPDEQRRVCDQILEGTPLRDVPRILGIGSKEFRRRLEDLRGPFLEVYERRSGD